MDMHFYSHSLIMYTILPKPESSELRLECHNVLVVLDKSLYSDVSCLGVYNKFS